MTTRENLTFIGAGGAELHGVIRMPDGPVRGAALMAHCFTCSKDLHTTTRLASALEANGWASMAFDFTGLGDSGGDFSSSTLSTDVGDLRRAAVAMLERRMGPCLLIGHSLGGAAAVLAAASLKTVDAVICIASPADALHVQHLFPDDAATSDAPYEICIGGRPFDVAPGFLDDLETHSVRESAAALGRPMLVIEAGNDTVVGADQTRALAEAGNADLVTIPGADHLFSNREHARQLADAVVEWASRHQAR